MTKLYGGSGNEGGQVVTLTQDGGILITGGSLSADGDFAGLINRGRLDIALVKLNASGEIEWTKLFGGTDIDVLTSTIQTSDGSFLLAGWTYSNDGDFEGFYPGDAGSNIFLLKVDREGNIQWKKSVGGSGQENMDELVELQDGSLLVLGETNSTDGDFAGLNRGAFDMFLLKLDQEGNRVWLKTFGGSGNDEGSYASLSDGKLLIVGRTSSTDGDFQGKQIQGENDIFLMEMDADQNISWVETIERNEDIFINHFFQTPGGELVLAGANSSNIQDIILIKAASNGDIMWVRTFGGSGVERVGQAFQTSNNNILVIGQTTSNDGDFAGHQIDTSGDIITINVDPTGNTNWIENFGGTKSDDVRHSVQTPAGNYLITGQSKSIDGIFEGLSHGENDIFLINMDLEERPAN
ncbi:MAG: hypothetical protein R3211_04415 [Balneolaceae bacterium]|nr:hypothetical protein [Balneolaceae bacterium]